MKYMSLKVERIDDANVDKAGEDEVQHSRKVKLVSDDMEITIKGAQDNVTGFVTGDSAEVSVKILEQKELFGGEDE